MKILSPLLYDVLFQCRHGFYHAYLIIGSLYVLLLRLMPQDVKEVLAPVLLFSDPAVLGCFFVGGMVLLEKEQNIYESLFVTPFRYRHFIWTRVLSLTALSTVVGLGIVLLAFGPVPHFFSFVLGLVGSSLFFTFLGLGLAFRASSLNNYILSASLYLSIFFVPLMHSLGFFSSPVLYLFPSLGSLLLLGAPWQGISGGQIIYSVAILVVATALAYRWSRVMVIRYCRGGVE